jgi:cell division protease FtsH
MADALMMYETIDENQIKDIMLGNEPKPPEGWDDSDSGSGKNSSADVKQSKKKKGNPKVGGPASQH